MFDFKQLASRPWNVLFAGTGLFLAGSSLVTGRLELHFYDFYVALDYEDICTVVSLSLAFLAIVYFYCRGLLPYKILSWLHIIVTILALVLCSVLVWEKGLARMPGRYDDYSAVTFLQAFSRLNESIAIVIALMLFAQVLFLVNFIIGILSKITRRT